MKLSHRKLREFRPDLYGWPGLGKRIRAWLDKKNFIRAYIEAHLENGDSRAAVVMCLDPFLVAAYSVDLDCVAMLRFPASLAKSYGFVNGARLLTVNTYRVSGKEDCDLIRGPQGQSPWLGFTPLIADFLTEDEDRLDERKGGISEREWERTLLLAREYLARFPGLARDGRPMLCGIPARPGARNRGMPLV